MSGIKAAMFHVALSSLLDPVAMLALTRSTIHETTIDFRGFTARQTVVDSADGPGYDIFAKDVIGSVPALPASAADDAAVAKEYHTFPKISFGDQGRDTLIALIKEESKKAKKQGRPYVVMEIGVWLGKSIAMWLNADENVYVIGIDPFDMPKFNHTGPKFNQRFAEHVVRHESQHSDGRHALITGYSPDAAKPFLNMKDLPIDMFYIDGGKIDDKLKFSKYLTESLKTFHASNPTAMFSGDDWEHHTTPTLQPILKAFAAEQHFQLAVSNRRTWFLARDLEKHSEAASMNFHVKDPKTYKGPTIKKILEEAAK